MYRFGPIGVPRSSPFSRFLKLRIINLILSILSKILMSEVNNYISLVNRKSISGIIFDILNLQYSIILNINRYYNTFIKYRLSLLIINIFKLIYYNIPNITL